MHAVGVVDHEHAGLHAADDEFVDLRQIGEVDAALFGQRLGFAHLLAEDEAQCRRREITQSIKPGLQQIAVFLQYGAAVHALAEHAERGKRRE